MPVPRSALSGRMAGHPASRKLRIGRSRCYLVEFVSIRCSTSAPLRQIWRI